MMDLPGRTRVAAWLLVPVLALAVGAPEARAEKTLRFALRTAATNLDPAQIADSSSRTVTAAIFEAPLEYEYLADPPRLRPNTAASMPEVSADFKTFTFRIRPGILFADDPAFQGRQRELRAEDYVYALKRFYDPRWKSPVLGALEGAQILGLSELRRDCIAMRRPFDYDRPVEGLRTLDRYTFQIRLALPQPRFLFNFSDGSSFGPVAREVAEAYGDQIGAHPVGTGPYVLQQWQTGSRIVLARNPRYRERRYDEHPNPADTRAVAIAAAFKGRQLPLVDKLVISVIDEAQPRWLALLHGEQDIDEAVPAPFAGRAAPKGQLSHELAARGLQLFRYPLSAVQTTVFAMDHPLVGGYAPQQVALRRAISLALNVRREIQQLHGGRAVPAQSVIGPRVFGYDPDLKTELSDFDPARARALLDMYRYLDRDGDGFRERPDGRPLVLRHAIQPDQQSRQLAELWQKDLADVGLKVVFDTATLAEHSKASRAGKLMIWSLDWRAGSPDGEDFLDLGYGPNQGSLNRARFDLPAFNALYDRQHSMHDGPERAALMASAARLLIAYMPYKARLHPLATALVQPWVLGYHRNNFVREFWQYVDIDSARIGR